MELQIRASGDEYGPVVEGLLLSTVVLRTTIVREVTCVEEDVRLVRASPNKKKTLKWKNRDSGVYRFRGFSFLDSGGSLHGKAGSTLGASLTLETMVGGAASLPTQRHNQRDHRTPTAKASTIRSTIITELIPKAILSCNRYVMHR
eukprot:6122918-Amphidinium_carterae.1